MGWGEDKIRISILATLTALVLFGLTFSSCKACDKKNKPADRNGKVSDTKTSNATAASGGTAGSGGDSSNTTDSDADLVNATDSDGNSSSIGHNLPPLTPTKLKVFLEAAARAKIAEVLRGYDLLAKTSSVAIACAIDPDTSNAFTKACLKSSDAFAKACAYDNSAGSVESKYLYEIYTVYLCRLGYARDLKMEYDNGAKRIDNKRTQACIALDNINSILKNTTLANIKRHIPYNLDFVEAWSAFEAVKEAADKQWQELCDAVDKDQTRPKKPGDKRT